VSETSHTSVLLHYLFILPIDHISHIHSIYYILYILLVSVELGYNQPRKKGGTVTLIARTHTYCTYYSVSCIRYVLYDRIPCFLPSDTSKSASSDFDFKSSLHSVIDLSRVSVDS